LSIYQERNPAVHDNSRLRIPQVEAYSALEIVPPEEREIGVVLPVGCGKSGLITITPFVFKPKRVLVVAPGISIAQQLAEDFNPTSPKFFYEKCCILEGPPFPEPVEIRGTTTNLSDLEVADVVITNIQQLQGENNRWLAALPADFFDLILFDEAHHNVAESWQVLRQSFPEARVVNFSATPRRADGQLMAGRIVYSYPVARAIQAGYVKRLKALILNPRTLRFVRREGESEVEVTLDEVRRLGEIDAGFRRSIVTSQETLKTIVDASIREVRRIRTETQDERFKIIASALNLEHCIQIVEAYRERGMSAEYVHSRADGETNKRSMQRLQNHELDVIVQVRKLGEGFDHSYLAVAAVFSIFGELSPFIQFVGRIMRVVEQNAPGSLKNQGTVVFHAGANIARRWSDFQTFSEADQAFFDQLLPIEELDFRDSDELAVEPVRQTQYRNTIDVKGQDRILVQEIPLLIRDEEAKQAFDLLASKGFTPDDFRQAYELQPIPTTRVRTRQAARESLDDRVRTAVGRILGENGINPEGHELDKRHIGITNFVALKGAIDRRINSLVGRSSGQRHEFSQADLDVINEQFDSLLAEVIGEMIDGKA
jgi:superfamily II DNA or RNA helicase